MITTTTLPYYFGFRQRSIHNQFWTLLVCTKLCSLWDWTGKKWKPRLKRKASIFFFSLIIAVNVSIIACTRGRGGFSPVNHCGECFNHCLYTGARWAFSSFFYQENWLPRYNWNIFESGVKHHNANLTIKDKKQLYQQEYDLHTIRLLWDICIQRGKDYYDIYF